MAWGWGFLGGVDGGSRGNRGGGELNLSHGNGRAAKEAKGTGMLIANPRSSQGPAEEGGLSAMRWTTQSSR